MEHENEYSNIPKGVKELIGKNLYNISNHPIEIVKRAVFTYFDSLKNYKFNKFEHLSPIVTVKQNFDDLLIPQEHPARNKSDTYYLNENEVLRTHTSAHETELLKDGNTTFLTVGDVYRKDEIDCCHHRVFHQLEGVSIIQNKTDKVPQEELKFVLGGLVEHLFPGHKYRFNEDYFPFTTDSIEVEVFYNDKWLEILGGGILQQKIVHSVFGDNCSDQYWAFGMGLERLAMILFSIPDIRYFWSSHPKFMDQFSSGDMSTTFQPYSLLSNITNDISFFIVDGFVLDVKDEKGENLKRWIEDNDFYEIVRDIGGNWVESVSLMDSFFHKKKGLHSRTFTITYSPYDPSLKDPSEFKALVFEIQNNLREHVKLNLHITLR